MGRVVFITLLFFLVAAPAAAQAPKFLFVSDARIFEGDDTAFIDPRFDDSNWEEVALQRLDPQERMVWFRARIDGDVLLRMSEEKPLGVFFMALASREVYFNGQPIGASGVPAATKESETAGNIDDVYFLPNELIKPGENILAVKISSHHFPVRVRGPFHALFITSYQAPNVFRREAYIPAIFAGGAIGLGAFYFLGLFAANRRDASSLALSILALAVIGQLTGEAWRAFQLYEYPLHMVRLLVILSFAVIAGSALAAFSALSFASHRLPLILGGGGMLAAIALFLPGFDAKTGFAILAFAFAAFGASMIGASNKRPGARVAAIGLALFIAAAFLDPRNFLDQNYYFLMAALIMMLFVVQIRLLDKAQRGREEAAIRAVRLRHELLKKQIQPHFMMNTLTALAEWIESDPKTGVKMIDALSHEMRLLYDMSELTLTPLSEELELCRRHLEVMSLRADVNFTLDADKIAPSIECPPAILLTLLENAFTHNEYREGAAFHMEANIDGSTVSIICRTPIRKPGKPSSRSGAGLAFIRARLTEAFGDQWRLDSQNTNDEWITSISWRTT